MLVTVALLVFLTAIVVFFTDEFIRMFNKLFAIREVKLFFPLLIASYLVYNYEYFALWMSYYCRQVLGDMLTFLVGIMPVFDASRSIAVVIILTLTSVLPVLIMDIFLHKKKLKGYEYPYLTSTIILIICATLFIML